MKPCEFQHKRSPRITQELKSSQGHGLTVRGNRFTSFCAAPKSCIHGLWEMGSQCKPALPHLFILHQDSFVFPQKPWKPKAGIMLVLWEIGRQDMITHSWSGSNLYGQVLQQPTAHRDGRFIPKEKPWKVYISWETPQLTHFLSVPG